MSTLTFRRDAFTRAQKRLAPFDFWVLCGTALLADPARAEFTGPWDALGEALGLVPVLLPPVFQRLRCQGFVRGQTDRPEGAHLHFDPILALAPAPSIPPNLPLEPSP